MITQCPKTGRTCEVTGCNGCWKDSTTQDEIIRMATEAGFLRTDISPYELLERFAAIVAAHEREACAKVCEEASIDNYGHCDGTIPSACAEYIRARGLK